MKIEEAANFLNISGDITPEIVKAAYRIASKLYHPDINPAGEEMMKIINAANDLLKEFTGKVDVGQDRTYPQAVNDALNAIIGLADLELEICGIWVWVGGNTFPHKDVLKATGFKFASKKKRWYFRPAEWKSRSRGKLTMDNIRDKFGSSRPAGRNTYAIAAQEAA